LFERKIVLKALKMAKDWKERLGVVYSTNPDFDYESNREEEPETLVPAMQRLKVVIDRKQRKGKTVTLVQGFTGKTDDLKELGKLLRTKCGTGGSEKEGEIILQGECEKKVREILRKEGYGMK
jgi:translation initiation factor 1